jgi:hypothetical protein
VTGADVGAVEMPEKRTGSPMTYMINGKQMHRRRGEWVSTVRN